MNSIQQLKDYAFANRVTSQMLKDILEGVLLPAGQNENYTYREGPLTVAFSIEEQPAPVMWARHLSISRQDNGLIGEIKVIELLKIFEFKELDLRKTYYKIDEDERFPITLHVLEPLDNTWEELLKKETDVDEVLH